MEQKLIAIISSALIENAMTETSTSDLGQKIVEAIFANKEIRQEIKEQIEEDWNAYCVEELPLIADYSSYNDMMSLSAELSLLATGKRKIDMYIDYTSERDYPTIDKEIVEMMFKKGHLPKLSPEVMETLEKAPKMSMEELEAACEEKLEEKSSTISKETINKLADARLASELHMTMDELEAACEEKPKKESNSFDELERIIDDEEPTMATTMQDVLANLEKIEREAAEFEYGSISDDTYNRIKEDRKNGMPTEEDDYYLDD